MVLGMAGLVLLWVSIPVLKGQWKGRAGERKVALGLRRIGACALNDVYLPLRDRIAQIDHLVCTEQGIVVLETKDWAGTLIDQGPKQPWILRQGSRTFTRHNPIAQNRWHRAVVSRYTQSVPVSTWVVLAGSGQFRGPTPESVFSVRETLARLQAMGLEPDRFPSEVQEAWERLSRHCLRDRFSRRRQLRQATRSVWRYVLEGYALELFGTGIGFLVLATVLAHTPL